MSRSARKSVLTCSALAIAIALLVTRRAGAVITITEIMYHPAGGDRNLEYIELHNETGDPADITGYYFSSGVTFVFTERTFLDPGAYIVVCANKQAIQSKYGIQNVAGDWELETSLDNSGEPIELANPGGAVEARVEYNDRGKWPTGADGTGHSLELEYVYSEMDDPDMWALSGVLGGSPGKANDTAAGALPVYINEGVIAGNPGERWIEVFNDGAQDLDLSGYHVTTDRLDLKQGTIPAGTSLPARRWVVLTEAVLGLDFTPDEVGRTFVALVDPAGSRVIDAHIFEPAYPAASEARVPDGDSLFTTAADPTPGAANRVTVPDGVIINEVMYHPIDGDSRREYLELYNRGSQAADLTGWKFTDGINFDIPGGTLLQADSYLVIARDPAFIRSTYGLPANAVIGPADQDAIDRFGVLRDEGERVSLLDARGNIADTVRYYDGGEWPRWADGGGSSMELIDPAQDNSEAQAWDSSDDSGKAVAKRYEYSGMFNGGEPELHLVMTGAGITILDDLSMTTKASVVVPTTTYFEFDGTWKYWKGVTEASDPPDLWRQTAFDDASWAEGAAPIGFGDGDEATMLADMRQVADPPQTGYLCFFLRKSFNVPDPAAVQGLILEIEYDDGYAAYLNGVEVATANLRPGERSIAARAITAKEKVKEVLDLSARKDLLVSGKNVLSVQVHNQTITSNDARWLARLVDGHFEIQTGPNLLKDGTFDTDAYKPFYLIQGTHVRSGRTSESPLSGAGSLKLIATGSGDNKVNRIETSNTGLTGLAARTEYQVSFLAKWVVGTQSLLTHGSNTGSASPSYATSHRLDVPLNLGTPGAVNSVTLRQVAQGGSRSMGPVISRVRHAPALPGANVPVTVSARVKDPDGVPSVMLHYTLDTPRLVGDPAVTSIPMVDPDGDGIYTAEIPGQVLKKRVIYHITATDGQGKEGRFPLDFPNRTGPLLLNPGAAVVNDMLYTIYRHDTPYAGRPLSYRVFIHQANEQYLGTRPLLSNDLVDSTFVFGDRDLYYNTKIRFSGSPFARQAWAESYRIRMPKDKSLHGSIESFNCEDHQGGGARDGRERISHYLIRYNQGKVSVPYSLQFLVQLQVGGSSDKVNEVREHVQTPNREFISRWFPGDDNGAFFEMDDRHDINDGGTRNGNTDGRCLYPPYGPVALGGDKEQYRYYFSLRLGEEADDFSELIDLAKLMTTATTPNDIFDAEVFQRMNVEAFCRNWAVRLNTDDWDQWSGTRGKNCYLYRPGQDGHWVLIPWDAELTYGSTAAFAPPALTATTNPTYSSAFAEVTRFLNRPRIKRIYYSVMHEMANNQFRSQFLIPWMQKLDAIGVQQTAVGKANGYIDQRKNMLVNVTRGVTNTVVDFVVTTNGGNPVEVEDSLVVIEGKASIEIREIDLLVDGKVPNPPFDIQFSSASVIGWVATGNLPIGAHTLDFMGYDLEDALVDSTSFMVTVGPPVVPSIVTISPSAVVAGERAAITGANLRAGLKVLFAGVESAEVAFDPAADPTRIEAVVPAGLPLGDAEVRVRNPNGKESEPHVVRVVAEKRRFIRGDVDLNLDLNLTDAIVTLRFLFQGGARPTCLDAADTDDSGTVNLTDPLVSVRFLFQGGPAPSAPHPGLGADTTEDVLDCAIGVE